MNDTQRPDARVRPPTRRERWTHWRTGQWPATYVAARLDHFDASTAWIATASMADLLADPDSRTEAPCPNA